MGIASMVIGIVSAILGFIPFCNYFAFIPAIVGLVLGIVEVVLKSKKKEPKGMSIAGIALNGAAIILIFLWTIVFAGAAATSSGELEKIMKNIPTADSIEVKEMQEKLKELQDLQKKMK